MKHFFLFLIIIISQLAAKSACRLDTTTQNKIITRIVQRLSKECNLNDSESQKLADCIHEFGEKIKACQHMQEHCNYLEIKLEETILKDFGREVYVEFRRITILEHKAAIEAIIEYQNNRKARKMKALT